MRRKVPVVSAEDGEVPQWVLDAGSMRGAIKVVGELVAQDQRNYYRYDVRAVMALRREQEAAARQWCAERGLSFHMTVQSASRPTETEALAGLMRGAGPRYAAAERSRREHRR